MLDVLSRILGTLILITIIALPIYLIFRHRASSWTGEVVDKETHVEDDEDGRRVVYDIKIKQNETNKVKNYTVNKKKYDDLSIGDNVKKQAGKMSFNKV